MLQLLLGTPARQELAEQSDDSRPVLLRSSLRRSFARVPPPRLRQTIDRTGSLLRLTETLDVPGRDAATHRHPQHGHVA